MFAIIIIIFPFSGRSLDGFIVITRKGDKDTRGLRHQVPNITILPLVFQRSRSACQIYRPRLVSCAAVDTSRLGGLNPPYLRPVEWAVHPPLAFSPFQLCHSPSFSNLGNWTMGNYVSRLPLLQSSTSEGHSEKRGVTSELPPCPAFPIQEPTQSFWTFPPSSISTHTSNDKFPTHADVGECPCLSWNPPEFMPAHAPPHSYHRVWNIWRVVCEDLA